MRQVKRFGSFGGIVVLTGMVAGAVVMGAGSAQALASDPGTAVERALDAEGPIVTPAEEALIEAKCGEVRGAGRGDNIRMEQGGVLVCSNGRRVDDPEVRALAARIERRAEARVKAVMSRPEVKAAMSGEIEARVREQMRDIQPRIEAAMREADAALARADAHVRAVEEAEQR